MYKLIFSIFRLTSPIVKSVSTRVRSITKYIPLLRGVLYQFKFKEVGFKCSIGKGVCIPSFNNSFHLKNRVALRNNVLLAGTGYLEIGERTVINEYSIITCTHHVEIGSDVMFAPRCYILDVDHEFSDLKIPISKQGYNSKKVKIGNGVWLGTQVVITKGVEIGEGSIIAANSVVTKNIPPFSIAAGIPAKVIKKR